MTGFLLFDSVQYQSRTITLQIRLGGLCLTQSALAMQCRAVPRRSVFLAAPAGSTGAELMCRVPTACMHPCHPCQPPVRVAKIPPCPSLRRCRPRRRGAPPHRGRHPPPPPASPRCRQCRATARGRRGARTPPRHSPLGCAAPAAPAGAARRPRPGLCFCLVRGVGRRGDAEGGRTTALASEESTT